MMKAGVLIVGLAVLLLVGASHALAVKHTSNDEVNAATPGDDTVARAAMTADEALARERRELRRVYAQHADDEAEFHFRRQMHDRMRAHQSEQRKKRKHLEQFRLMKLLELLDLNEEQETEFIRAFRELRRELRKIDERRDEILRTLGGGLESGDMPDDEINRLVDDLLGIEGEKRRLTDQFLRDSRGYLSTRQIAKFVLFRERFEYELLEQVRSFRERIRKHGAPGEPFDKR